jgi:hypothetical protein
MQRRTTVIAILLALGIPSVSSAAGQWVRFAGCPVAGVEHGCIVVKSGPATYNVSAAIPKIRLRGLGIAGRGMVDGGVSYCMQGGILRNISYAYTRQRCPIIGR